MTFADLNIVASSTWAVITSNGDVFIWIFSGLTALFVVGIIIKGSKQFIFGGSKILKSLFKR